MDSTVGITNLGASQVISNTTTVLGRKLRKDRNTRRRSKKAKPSQEQPVSTFATQGEYLQWLDATLINRNHFLPEQEKWLWEYAGPDIMGAKVNWEVCSQEYYKMFNEKRSGERLNLHWYYVNRKRKAGVEEVIKENLSINTKGGAADIGRTIETFGNCISEVVEYENPGLENGGVDPIWLSISDGTVEEALQKVLGNSWDLEVPTPVGPSTLQAMASAALGESATFPEPSWSQMERLDLEFLNGFANISTPEFESNTSLKLDSAADAWVSGRGNEFQDPGLGTGLPPINEMVFHHEYCHFEDAGNSSQVSELERKNSPRLPIRDTNGLLHVYTPSSVHTMKLRSECEDTVYFGPLGQRYIESPTSNAQLTEILNALLLIPLHREAVIYSSSRYAINCVTVWCIRWARLGWIENRKVVENRAIIQEAICLMNRRSEVGSRTMFEWVEEAKEE